MTLHHAPPGELHGSFAVKGMVDYWTKDYLRQVEALDTVGRLHGLRGRADGRTRGVRAFGFWMGVLSLRWLRYAWQGRPKTAVDECLLELEGLALPFGVYDVVGRTGELWDCVRKATMNTGSAIQECIAISDRAGRAIAWKCSDAELERIVPFGSDLEVLLMNASLALSTNDRTARSGVPALADWCAGQLPSWFDENTTAAMLKFLKETPQRVERNKGSGSQLLAEGESLLQAAYHFLASQT